MVIFSHELFLLTAQFLQRHLFLLSYKFYKEMMRSIPLWVELGRFWSNWSCLCLVKKVNNHCRQGGLPLYKSHCAELLSHFVPHRPSFDVAKVLLHHKVAIELLFELGRELSQEVFCMVEINNTTRISALNIVGKYDSFLQNSRTQGVRGPWKYSIDLNC